jgi:Zn-dependent protease
MSLNLSLVTLLARLIVLLLATPIHEWAHAWSAYELGDDTASQQGRMTLNPLAHLDLFGGVLIMLTGFGWAKPVPVNPLRMRVAPRAGMALSALAGPASNFLLTMLCAIPFRLGWLALRDVGFGASPLNLNLATLIWTIAQISLGLALFNLLPFYPLDGEKVLVGLVPRGWDDRLLALRPISPYLLMAVLFLLPRLGLDIAGILIGSVMIPLNRLLFVW